MAENNSGRNTVGAVRDILIYIAGKILGMLIILLGVFLMVSGMKSMKTKNANLDILNRCVSSATASVGSVDTGEYVDNDGYTKKLYIVYYTFDVNGVPFNDYYESTHQIGKGDSFQVIYNPDNPNEHFSESEKNDMPTDTKADKALFAGGIVLIAISVLFILRSILHEIKQIKKYGKHLISTTAKVEKVNKGYPDDEGNYLCTIYYTFEAYGRKIKDSYITQTKEPEMKTIEVKYLADDPGEHFTIWEQNDLPGKKMLWYANVAAGIMALAAGAVLIFIALENWV